MLVHGEIWTTKEFFVYPNEYVTWAIQIVMYPYVTGLVAGAFVLSSLYHVFGIKQLKEIARFALVFSFALLPVAMLPLQLHLQHPLRGIEVMMTPHFTSAIAAFGIVISTYGTIVALEIWFLYRKYFVETAQALKSKPDKSGLDGIRQAIFSILTLGAWDISEAAMHRDHKVTKILAAIGIPVACFLHGYAGFIFGSVKANALWMTPLMPVIFIMSAIVSGIALCLLVYIVVMETRKHYAKVKNRSRLHYGFQDLEHIRGVEDHEIRLTTKYLIAFMVLAFTLEILDLVFRGYTAMKSWDALRTVLYSRDAFKLFFLQYTVGNLIPFILLLWPRISTKRAVVATILVLFGVFMMRWNVVIGGQGFSSSFHGFMDYHLPIIPTNIETFKEGVPGMIIDAVTPFILFYILNKFTPVFIAEKEPE
jgi:Ni/Fe-hydrogenase subunit HybB-like protein